MIKITRIILIKYILYNSYQSPIPEPDCGKDAFDSGVGRNLLPTITPPISYVQLLKTNPPKSFMDYIEQQHGETSLSSISSERLKKLIINRLKVLIEGDSGEFFSEEYTILQKCLEELEA